MDGETLTTIFLVGGIVFMILETFIPGGVSFFLGVSGLLVAGLRWMGIVASPLTSVITWLFTSVGLILAMRPLLMKYWGGESNYKLANEDIEAMDQVVDVIEPVNAKDQSGRVRFQGISWQAKTLEGEIPAGAKAKIRYRDNVTWIVEPVNDIEQ
ncbi:Membrane protein implicated in regulation of membrane protease activity [Fodinibius salinus]|uniref:Membrane protein implicated in regulation of membrane protease activity n=1 Tax=Fodinibius salinus TaxID=860790 RepID=A0A5D3YGH9_9BACT|nr:NfeD family protein [Fodinibius salinus]TYP92793.1 Membrane protein implicated in regulation of membrane protease activity [Fodinibius salinus]